MTPSLEQFKAQYPDSALIAELVSVHEGQYVVRAAVVRNAETLATGLAADADVQIAEDRARERAIAVLGIATTLSPSNGQSNGQSNGTAPLQTSPPAANGKSQPLLSVVPQAATVTNISAVDLPASIPSEKALTTLTTLTVEADPLPLSEPQVEDVVVYNDADPLPDEDDLGPPIDALEEGAGQRARQSAELEDETVNSGTVAKPTKPSAATIALETFSTSANPVDLSDVIAQTDVELKRLGWTSTQGREYLEQNYGKRSRQQLTDDELMSFLLYLEDQP